MWGEAQTPPLSTWQDGGLGQDYYFSYLSTLMQMLKSKINPSFHRSVGFYK